MKKLATMVLLAGVTLTLSACGNNTSTTTTKHSSSTVTKSSKKSQTSHSTKKEPATSTKNSTSSKSNSKTSSSTQSSSSQTSSSNSTNQSVDTSQPNQQTSDQSQSLTQGEINRQRGYDPKGNPIMPGSDHAPGANPDGTPDAWVQGQIDWAKKNGYLNSDGSPTQKEIEAENEVDQNSNYDESDE